MIRKLFMIFVTAMATAIGSMMLTWVAIGIFWPSTNIETCLLFLMIFFMLGGVAGGVLCYFVLQEQKNKIEKARHSGVYPPEGQVTEKDIIRLALGGERKLAINAYREFHGCNFRRAKNAVIAIERSSPLP